MSTVTRPPAHPTRDQEPVHFVPHETPEDEWRPPQNLDAPPARPGMSQLWVRTAIGSEEDPTNVSRYYQEGWVPRRADTVPVEFAPPSIKEGQFAGCVGVHGMILFELPIEKVRQRRAYYANRTRRQTEAVNQDILRVQSAQVPFFEKRESRVTVGRQVVAASDTEE